MSLTSTNGFRNGCNEIHHSTHIQLRHCEQTKEKPSSINEYIALVKRQTDILQQLVCDFVIVDKQDIRFEHLVSIKL